MKKAVLKSSVLLSSLVVSSIALAQAPAAAPEAKKEEAKKDEVVKTVVPYGILEAITNLSDSERQNTPDFNTYIVRFGLKVSEGLLRGQLETNINGNTTLAGATTNGVLIRRADVGLALPSKTTILFGRTRMGNADAWGMDQTYATDGYGGLDGVQLLQEIPVSEGNSVGLRLGIGNAMSVPSNKGYATMVNSVKKEKAVIAGFSAKVSGVKAAFIYGVEKNALTEAFVAPVAADAAKDIKEVKAAGKTRDATHIEASLGYDMDGFGGGFWFQRVTQGAAKPITKIDGGKMTLGDASVADDAVEKTTDFWGVGVNGDSTLFGVADLLQKGDKIVYGASYMLYTDRSKFKDDATGSASSKKDDEKKNDKNEFVVGVGYGIGGAVIEFDVKADNSKAKQFSNSSGEKNKKKGSVLTEIAATYVF